MAEGSKKQSRFDLIIGAVDRLSGPFRAMQARMDAMGKAAGQLKGNLRRLGSVSGLQRLAGAVGDVRGRLRNVVAESKNAISGVTGLVGKLSLAFGAAGGGALALAKATAAAGDKAAKSAQRAGVGITVWQEYAHAASLSDVNEEQLAKGFRSLQDAALKAAGGDKAKVELLRLAGIDPKTTQGEVKNAEQLFLELADSVQKLQDAGQGAKAVNLLTAIAGKQGAQLMPMLAGGAKGLKELRAEAHKLGIVFKDEDARASEAFNDSLSRAGDALKGVGYTIGRVVLPPLTKLVDKFTAWASGNREVMGTGFAEWVESIDIDALWGKVESGLSTLNDLRKRISEIVDGLGGWETIAKVVGALIATKLVVAVGSLAASFYTLGAAMLTTPVGWLLAAAAAIYSIYKNWDTLTQAASETMDAMREGDEEDVDYEALYGENAGNIGENATEPSWAYKRKPKDRTEDATTPSASPKNPGSAAGVPNTPFASPQTPGSAAGVPNTPFAPPQNLGATAAGVTQHTKTETVERNELTVKIRPVEGYNIQAALSGQSVGDILKMDNGQLMQGAF